MERVTRSVCKKYGATYQFNYARHTTPLFNQKSAIDLVEYAGEILVGYNNLDPNQQLMVGEDMSFFLDRIPGAFFLVGAANQEVGAIYQHHSPLFKIDEHSLKIGAEMLELIVIKALHSGSVKEKIG